MLIDGLKFACEPCIRGHRQATCAHADRPLREIAKRGRPVTACVQCRELRKNSNSHRTCNHQEKTDVPEVMVKTLPNGAGGLESLSLVRRPSSTRSRSSVSSAPSAASASQRVPTSSAATSTASASDQDLAHVGRKKSLSRPASVSRRSSSAREKKPHDFAHGHLADHPAHVSAVYSPYPQHAPKEHVHHHHSPPGPSPLSKGAERSASSNAAKKIKAEGQPPVPPLPESALALPHLPSLASTPSRSNSTPASASPPALLLSTPPIAAPHQASAALTTEQLASAYFFRDLPRQSEAFAVPPAAMSAPDPAMQAYFESPVLSGPGVSPDGGFDPYTIAMPMAEEPSLTLLDAGGLSISPALSLPEIDPAAAVYVLGPVRDRSSVVLAPMYGAGEAFYNDPEPAFPPSISVASDVPLYAYASAPSTSASVGAWAPQDYPAPSSTASSDVFDLHGVRPDSALYGYPLEPVASNTLSSYSSASASGAPSLSATSALERLDLDFDLDLDRAGLSSASHSARATPPQPLGAGQAQQATDLDGILEWLAAASSGPPPPAPPLHQTDSASSSGVQSVWTSAPPSSYGASGREDNEESPPAPGPSGASRVAFDTPDAHDGYRPSSAFGTFASGGEEDGEAEEDGEPRGDNDLEMLRTATITCCDPSASASASASHSSDEGGWAEGDGGGAIDEPFSLADLDLERFGVDEEWLRSLGLFGAQPEGEGDEDDGYEEDDEASVVGRREAGGPDGEEDDPRGWTEEDWVAAPTPPAHGPSDELESAGAGAAGEDAVVKDEPVSDDEFGPSIAAVALKPEDERDREEQGLNRGELWWS